MEIYDDSPIEMTTTHWHKLQVVAAAVREVVLENFRADSCIASVRVLDEVCRRTPGAELIPIKARTCIFNPAVVQYLAENENASPVDAVQQEGGWSVGIGFGATPLGPNKWPGHLVAIWKQDGEQYLIDPSIDQASRLQYDMDLSPLCVPIPGEIKDENDIEACFEWCRCMCIYRGDSTIPSFTESPDWKRSDAMKLFAHDALIRARKSIRT